MFLLPHSSAFPRSVTSYSKQIYRSKDSPLYRKGNKILLGLAAYNAILFIATNFYYVWRNRYGSHIQNFNALWPAEFMNDSKRDQIWDMMSQDQRLEYLATTKDKGNKR